MTNQPETATITDRLPAVGATISRFALLDFESRVFDQNAEHHNQPGDLIGLYNIESIDGDVLNINATIAGSVWKGHTSTSYYAKAKDQQRPITIILKPASSA